MDYRKLFENELEDARVVVREKEHQMYLLTHRPPGCVCDPREWYDNDIPPPCSEFRPCAGEPDLCECEHRKECHKERE